MCTWHWLRFKTFVIVSNQEIDEFLLGNLGTVLVIKVVTTGIKWQGVYGILYTGNACHIEFLVSVPLLQKKYCFIYKLLYRMNIKFSVQYVIWVTLKITGRSVCHSYCVIETIVKGFLHLIEHATSGVFNFVQHLPFSAHLTFLH